MSSYGYIKAVGDSDYNFGYSDFTVEFFMEPTAVNSNSAQTLFEITNNESNAAQNYQKTRFFSTIESGNLNAYAIQTLDVISLGSNISFFTSPVVLTDDFRIYYDGTLLQNGQYSISGSNISINSNVIVTHATTVELGEILFSINGGQVTNGTTHFISAERYQNQFYLFLDGVSQSPSVPAYQAIPCQELPWMSNTANVLNRTGSPALLTIGANRDGKDPFFGMFGDFKITNGLSRHVPTIKNTNTITSNLADSQLGLRSADIVIDGGAFVDSISSYSPEELVPAQIFDTLNIQVYQSDNSNLNSNILGYSIFKPTIMAGPIGSYTLNISNASSYKIPWTTLNSSDASVLINGVVQSADNWSVSKGIFTANLGSTTSGNIQIIATGPTNYYTISANGVSTLVGNLYPTSNAIVLSNVSGFITPVIGALNNTNNVAINSRGKIFINQECITYLYMDTANCVLSGLTRGVAGTGVPPVHLASSQVISASYDRDLFNLSHSDPGERVWYTTPFNNTSLQNTYSTISNILVAYGTVPPVTPF